MAGVHGILVGSGAGTFIFNQTISTNTARYDLRAAAIAAGWNQSTPLLATITINSGIYVFGNSTAFPAFNRGGSFPTGSSLNLINNGFIVGMGGNGGNGSNNGAAGAGSAGLPGGPALSSGLVATITNNGTIAGGGGGGGGGQGVAGLYSDGETSSTTYHSGGGGGGGRGGFLGIATGSGGSVGGGSGSHTAAGAGGPRQPAWNGTYQEPNATGAGGAGGGWGQAGSAGGSAILAPISFGPGPYAGGAAGAAVNGDSNITWNVLGTILGARNSS